MGDNDVCAVILAGGRSSRMGCDKALLRIAGRSLMEIIINRVRPVTGQILISADKSIKYAAFDYPVIPDLFKGHGPLAGLHAAMLWKASPRYLALACDLPNLQTGFLQSLINRCDDVDAVIPRTGDGVAHPLCAVYRDTCLPVIEQALKKGDNKVIETFLSGSLSIRWADPRENGYNDADLANINTPEDLRKLAGIHDPEFQNNSTY